MTLQKSLPTKEFSSRSENLFGVNQQEKEGWEIVQHSFEGNLLPIEIEDNSSIIQLHNSSSEKAIINNCNNIKSISNKTSSTLVIDNKPGQNTTRAKNKLNSSSHNKQVVNNNLKEKRKSIGTISRTKTELDKKKSISSQKTKKTKTNMSAETGDDVPSLGVDNLLNRRHSAPPKLTLAFKNRHLKERPSPLRTTITSSDASSAPLILSPKILELRRSETFQSKSSTSNDDINNNSNVSDSNNVKNINTKKTKKIEVKNEAKNEKSISKPRRKMTVKSPTRKNTLQKGENMDVIIARLEEQNSSLPPQDSTGFLLARLERQNDMLDNDPKFKANLETTIPAIIIEQSSDEVILPVLDGENIDLDFWTALIQDYTSVATKLPHLLAAKLQEGLPQELRGLLWQSMCQASSTYLETMYSQLLSESSPYDKIIQRDLARTFPTIEMFKEENGNGQTMLWNVLKAYSLYDPLVGYCQGLGFLVGPLLMNMGEAQAFCVFVRLMETYDMRTMFTLKMEGLQQRLYQFSALLSQICPELHAHFQKHGVHPAMYASQWFLSLFAYTYPLPLVYRIYDVVFAEGAPETIMRVAIALLKNNEAKLLSFEEFEDLLEFLTSKLYESYNNEPTGLIKDAMALSSVITKAKLDQLSDVYVKDLEDQKKHTEELAASSRSRSSVNTIHDVESSSSENINTTASDQSSNSSESEAIPSSTPTTTSFFSNSATMGVLHQQIEDLVTALSQLQKEHADVTDQLVNMKMEKMDLVTEAEEMKSKLRGLEKENKRMSSASVLSIDSATTLNDESVGRHSSKFASSPFEPTVDQFIKQQISYLTESPRMTRRSSVPTYITMINSLNPEDQKFGKYNLEDWAIELKKSLQREAELTEELNRVKRGKDDLLHDNIELIKHVEELETVITNTTQSHKALLDKNIFLQTEIERLDVEATQALYEQSTMESDVKDVKILRFDNVKLSKENEKYKKEIEILKAKLSWQQGVDEDNNITTSNTISMPINPRRTSFLNFFNPSNERVTCSKDCVKRVENAEETLKQVQSMLLESENARNSMSVQLEELNHLINGFADISEIEPFDPEEISVNVNAQYPSVKPKPENRLSSSLSLASFFANS
ncbi:9798_t:CDS:2 [Diversispora eburnea]|uniref:9798_t:CDS:1 n=1 Tax=Diversispora eburnea TaxID=1213867 RepID=A0A9N8V9Q2_9GLOM|nr:9798_t:CDS:2 [Diversispora eburnea]